MSTNCINASILGSKSFPEEGSGCCISQPVIPLPTAITVFSLHTDHITSWDEVTVLIVQGYSEKLGKTCHYVCMIKWTVQYGSFWNKAGDRFWFHAQNEHNLGELEVFLSKALVT